MIDRIHGIGFFCDDIREEVGGTTTVVGILKDNFAVPSVPGFIPKLGVYARIHIPVACEPTEARLFITIPGQDRTQIGYADISLMEETIAQAKADGSANGGIVMSAVASPLQILAPGHITLECECAGEAVILGSLNIVIAAPLELDQQTTH